MFLVVPWKDTCAHLTCIKIDTLLCIIFFLVTSFKRPFLLEAINVHYLPFYIKKKLTRMGSFYKMASKIFIFFSIPWED
jgi:hypothetical protein